MIKIWQYLMQSLLPIYLHKSLCFDPIVIAAFYIIILDKPLQWELLHYSKA